MERKSQLAKALYEYLLKTKITHKKTKTQQ